MTSRRAFLGAAAAALSLPIDGADTTDADGDNEREDTTTATEYRSDPSAWPAASETFGEFFGVLDVDPEYPDLTVTVKQYPDQEGMPVDLDMQFGQLHLGPGLEPDEARALGQALIDAADDVDEWRREHWPQERIDRYG